MEEMLENYFEKISKLKAEEWMAIVDKHLSDDLIEVFVGHLEDFYGVRDEEELGHLAQIMISGYICAKETTLS